MLYRATFERFHFEFDPPLRQTAEVLFECDVPRENEEFSDAAHEAMWDAVWKQNPQWADPRGPTDSDHGWSSVLGGYDIKMAHKKANIHPRQPRAKS